MIPDPEKIVDTLHVVMRALNNAGWDQDPRLFTINGMTTPGADGQARDGFEIWQVPAPIGMGRSEEISSELIGFALGLCYADVFPTPEMARSALGENFAGILFMHESWCLSVTEEQREEIGGRRFADVPGAEERRDLLAVDVTGRTYMLAQTRGSNDVEVVWTSPDGTVVVGDAVVIGGQIPSAIKLMAIGLCQFLEAGEHAMPPVLPLLPGEEQSLNVPLLVARMMAQVRT